MRHGILTTTLGVLAAITGLASSVQAQPQVAYSSRTGATTLSGESLVGIQNRSVQNDFNRLFLGNPSVPTANSTGTIRNNSETNSAVSSNNLNTQQPGVLQISNNVQIISNEPLYYPITRVPGQEHVPFYNADGIQVQLNP